MEILITFATLFLTGLLAFIVFLLDDNYKEKCKKRFLEQQKDEKERIISFIDGFGRKR